MDCEERHTVTLRNGVKLTQDGWLETLTRDQVMMIMMIRRRRRKMMMTMTMMMMMMTLPVTLHVSCQDPTRLVQRGNGPS